MPKEPVQDQKTNTQTIQAVLAEQIFTRFTSDGPFHRPRVKRILREISICDDLTAAQRREVLRLVEDFADVFALAVEEV